jgi:solute carrier family 25 oxoglutarate transporter 11
MAQMDNIFEKLKYFMIAGLSGICATSCVHPVDTLKVRCQIINESFGAKGERHIVNPIRVAHQMWREAGVVAFYKGFDSSLFKQVTYSTMRLGIYKYLYDKGVKEQGRVSLLKKIQYSITSAVCAILLGNPADMTMVRRQGDLALPPEQRRNYKNVFDAFIRIVRHEGFFALWTGIHYSMVRVIAATVSQMTTFEEVKERFKVWRGVTDDDIYSRAVAASASGLVCSLTALPFDNMKVKYQKMKLLPDGTWPYKSLLDVYVKTFRREGIFGFWTGLPAFYMYVAPHTLITLISQDYFHILFSKNRNH